MSQTEGKVLKHSKATRIMHGIVLVSFVLLSITGIIFLVKTNAAASTLHRFAGVAFTLAPAIYIVFRFKRFAAFIDTITTFTKDDIGWLMKMGGYIPFIKADNVPAQDKYNAGQKILGNLVIIGCLLLIVTGFPMWFGAHQLAPVYLNLCYTIHRWSAIIMILAISGHFFLAAIYPASRGELGTMINGGYVDAEFTAHHNGKWFAQLEEKKQN